MTFINNAFNYNLNQGFGYGCGNNNSVSNMPANQNASQSAMLGLGMLFAGMDMIDNGQLDGSLMSFLNSGSNSLCSNQEQNYGTNQAAAYSLPQNSFLQFLNAFMQGVLQMLASINNYDQSASQNPYNSSLSSTPQYDFSGKNNGISSASGIGASSSLTNAKPSSATNNPGAGTFGGTKLSQEQVDNARIIAEVGAEMGASKRDIATAIATAMQESSLKNLNYGDRDSVGLFQQRPSCGWGTVEQCTNPRYAATQFYNHLLKDSDRNSKSLTEAAQDVQRSAYPDAYAKWENMAVSLTNSIC